MARQPAFTPAETAAIEGALHRFPIREVCLYRLMVATGLRIAEALKIRICDVYSNGAVRSDLVCERANLKGGRGARRKVVRSRTIPLHESLKLVVRELVFSIVGSSPQDPALAQPLFQSWKGRALSRRQATYRLRDILLAAGLHDRSGYGWHCARRTFAAAIYDMTGHDINLTRQVMGHAHLETTMIYLPENDAAARAAILSLGCPAATAQNQKAAMAAADFAELRAGLV